MGDNCGCKKDRVFKQGARPPVYLRVRAETRPYMTDELIKKGNQEITLKYKNKGIPHPILP